MAFQVPCKVGAAAQDDPCGLWLAVTPSDSVNFSAGDGATRAIYVGVSGNVVGVDCFGNVVTFLSLPIGVHRMRLTRINASSTTATNIIAGF